MKVEIDNEEMVKLLQIESTLMERYKRLRKDLLDMSNLNFSWQRQTDKEIDDLKVSLKELTQKIGDGK